MSWLAQLAAKQEARKLARAATTPTLKWDYVDRPPGFSDLGQDFTTIFPPGLSPDPAVVLAIKAFCPDYVPLWVHWKFRACWDDSHQEELVYGRHVLARLVTDPKLAKHEFPGLAPGIANYMERIFMERTEHKPGETDLPGDFQPLNWARVEELRQTYGKFKELSPWEYAKKLVLTPFELKLKAAMKRALERTEARTDAQKYFQKQIDNMSELDMKNYALHGPERKAPREYTGLGINQTTGGN